MPFIIKNGKYYGSGGGSGDTNSVELTQAEYNELLTDGKVDDETIYFIKDDDNTPDTTAEIGDTYIGDIGDGTITGAISELNSNLEWKFLGTVDKDNAVNLPSGDYKELRFEIYSKYTSAASKVVGRKEMSKPDEFLVAVHSYYYSETEYMTIGCAVSTANKIISFNPGWFSAKYNNIAFSMDDMYLLMANVYYR